MEKLGLLDIDDDNSLIEIETKSGRRTVGKVLELRAKDEQRNNIIRLGTIIRFNLLLGAPGDNLKTVIVRKAVKAVPLQQVTVHSQPGQPPVGGFYLQKKLQGIPLYSTDQCVGTTVPNSDYRWYLFLIGSRWWKQEDMKHYGGVTRHYHMYMYSIVSRL